MFSVFARMSDRWGTKKIRRIREETANQLWNLYFLIFSITHSCFFVALS